MFSLFRKKAVPVPLEQQLKTLAECGIRLNAGASIDDLFMFHSREEHEANPYKELIPILGFELEREPFAPLCLRLWMCDHERIEGDGSYADVITRLDLMSERSLAITNISDRVDIDDEIALVEFDLNGSRVHWDAKVNNDWLDPSVVVRFDDLLKTRTPFRIYSGHADFGQCSFFACLKSSEFERFQELATFKLRTIDRS